MRTNRIGLPITGIVLALAGLGTTGHAVAAGIPTNLAVYQITMTGDTYNGYYPFSRSGYLIVEPTLTAAGGVNFNNGRNARDVGLFSGSPPTSPSRGSIWFATNTTIYSKAGLGNWAQGLAGLDVAYVTADESTRILNVAVDGRFWGLPAARSSQLNCFNATGGLTSWIYQIIQGSIRLQFSADGRTVTGVCTFTGNGFIQPAQVPYRASLSGTRVQ